MAPRGGARDPTGAADGANAGDAESGQPFSVQADHTDATDPTTKQLVPVDGYRLRQNGTVAVTLPFSARDAQGHVTFAFPSGWPAGVYHILVTAYNVIDGVTNEAPLPSSTAISASRSVARRPHRRHRDEAVGGRSVRLRSRYQRLAGRSTAV